MIDRKTCVRWLEAAKLAGREDFGRSLAADWLAAWPGDRRIRFWLATLEFEKGAAKSACKHLQRILLADPEYSPAYPPLAESLRTLGAEARAELFAACGLALRGQPLTAPESSWAEALVRAVTSLASGDLKGSLAASERVLMLNLESPLPLLLNIRARLKLGDRPASIALARAGHERWPECVFFRALTADDLISQGVIQDGLRTLHSAVTEDPIGELVSRALGEDHPYREMWPEQLSIKLSRPIPADIAAVLGDNRLGGGAHVSAPGAEAADHPSLLGSSGKHEPAQDAPAEAAKPSIPPPPDPAAHAPPPEDLPSPEPWEAFRGPDPGPETPKVEDTPEDLEDLRQDFDRLASRLNLPLRRGDEDRRVPAYIILSSRTRLAQEFGEDKFQRLHAAITALARASRRRPGWSAYQMYIDDPVSLESFQLIPADPGNAWQIKIRLAELDQVLAQRGEMIGALLLVGGPRIIPFHLLPNPTDDVDDAVPSDNPYATTDENYFAPEWAVGRLPIDTEPDLLVELLQKAARSHLWAYVPEPPLIRVSRWIRGLLGRILGGRLNSLGYSASIWRKASVDVFRAIGEPRALMTSPPIEAATLPPSATRPVRLSYFNLHGLEDAPEWFGQRDPLRDREGAEEFPIALRPRDIVNGGRAPKVVFTEACYGANVHGKTPESALCLRFLASGSQAVVGSTKVSYGSVTPPLLAADLLGKLFWENIGGRLPSGEALRRAKLQLAAEMHRRQGFLDGEDQKALISFVLFGDPLYAPHHGGLAPGQKTIIRRKTRPTRMKTACALGGPDIPAGELDAVPLETVKSIVSKYLPGMTEANCRVRHQHLGCPAEDHACPTNELGIESLPGFDETYVVTFSKTRARNEHNHFHYAKLTLDAKGKILKLAVSR